MAEVQRYRALRSLPSTGPVAASGFGQGPMNCVRVKVSPNVHFLRQHDIVLTLPFPSEPQHGAMPVQDAHN